MSPLPMRWTITLTWGSVNTNANVDLKIVLGITYFYQKTEATLLYRRGVGNFLLSFIKISAMSFKVLFMCGWEEPPIRPKRYTRVKGMNQRQRQKPMTSARLCALTWTCAWERGCWFGGPHLPFLHVPHALLTSVAH